MKIAEIISCLEKIAPLSYQEDYDNAGLIVGDAQQEVTGAIVSLDCIEAIVDEAIKKGCNLIISHHPIVFRGLKKLNGKTYIERVVLKAIKNDIAIYAIHTNLDNVATGVNKKISDLIGLKDCRILNPKDNILKKLVTFCPESDAEKVKAALFDAGAGSIGNYSECSFSTNGTGTFSAGEGTNPYVGEIGKRHVEAETRIETIFPAQLEKRIIAALIEAHPYEEIAFDIYPLENAFDQVGSGMIGFLEIETDELSFLKKVKEIFNAKVIRHTKLSEKTIRKIAVCGGSGSFLLNKAIAAGADVFITADYKYHEFFDADEKILIADIGHFESEQFTSNLLIEIIQKKFPNFALHLTEYNTNPINYLI